MPESWSGTAVVVGLANIENRPPLWVETPPDGCSVALTLDNTLPDCDVITGLFKSESDNSREKLD
jgi:hypothetical protein